MTELFTTLVIQDVDNAPLAMPEKTSAGSAAILLTFSLDDAATRDLYEVLTRRFARVEILSAARLLDDAALRVRPEYGCLVAEAPDRVWVGKKTLRQAFTFEGRLSLWYLSETFGRRSDVYPTFTRLCQLEVVRSLTATRRIGRCLLLSRDQNFWLLMHDFCKQSGIPLASPRPSEKPVIRSLPRILAGSLVWFATTMVQTILARRLLKQQPGINTSVRSSCAFHTVFPLLWRGRNLEQDEKYGDTLKVMQAMGRLTPVYALSFIADGFHQQVNLKEFRNLRRWLTNRWRMSGLAVCLLDAYASGRDILRALLTISLVWKYYRLERCQGFQDYWRYKGVSFFPFIREELRTSMLRTPRYLLHALRVRRFVQQTSPCGLVYPLFDFGFGRAVAYGVRTAGTGTVLIGVQEGPYAKRKLSTYHYPGELSLNSGGSKDFLLSPPLPDWVILEGRGARERLQESGYPTGRLYVGGAPRVDRLVQIPCWREHRHERRKVAGRIEGKKIVLVAFGQHDAKPIMAACLPVLEKRGDYHFVFKLHPRGGKTPQEIQEYLAGHNLAGTCSIKTGDIYQLLPGADVIVATYSSVAMEAAALGYPVICLHLPNLVNATPLLDLEVPNVLFAAANSEALMTALDRAIGNVGLPAAAEQEIEAYFFYRLDGRSAERWAQKIVEVLGATHI